MKWIDPNIELVSCGQTGWTDWDRIVLEGLAPYVNHHSIHIYTGSSDYYSNVLAPHQAERALRNCRAMIDLVRYNQNISHPIHVAYDEWNVWFRERTPESKLEERYCQTVKIANLAQLVNVIAPIFTNKEGLFLQTIYHPLRLYAEHMQDIALDAFVDCETYAPQADQETSQWPHRVADMGPFNLLDVAVTCDTSRKNLMVSVVNRDLEKAHTTTIQLADNAAVASGVAYEVNGGNPDIVNSFEQPQAVGVQEHHLDLAGQDVTYTFPAHSLTVLKLQLA
jgi:alpha-L-arabinofuranosidase